MFGKKTKYIIIPILILVMGYIIFDSTSQPTVNDLNGGFKEVATYRNENNTGPITNIYAVTVKDTLWEEMTKYGDLMPYTKYGTTTVYFFREGGAVPQKLSPLQNEFDENCIGKYLKDQNGQVSFVRNPFEK